MGGVVVMSGCGMPLSLVAVVARCSYTIIVILVRNIPMSNGNLSSSITAFSLLPVMVKPSLFVAAAAVDEKTGRDLIVRETRRNAMIDYTTQRQ